MSALLSWWKFGLIFAALCASMGLIGTVSAETRDDRPIAKGLTLQAIILTFVVAAWYFGGSSNLRLGGLVIVVLLLIQSISGLLEDDTGETSPSE